MRLHPLVALSAVLLFGGSSCKPASEAVCGNSVKEDGEACDDGNAVDDDTCSNSCTVVETPNILEETFTNPPELDPDSSGVRQLTFGPAAVELEGETFCLQTFNGMVPAPTWRIPASTSARSIRVDYDNTFTKSNTQPIAGGASYDFNETNLHTHGFHVQPERSSDDLFYGDNVLLHLAPGESAQYRYDIDEDRTHEAGTFWYHPHVHGSTAIQVANGMAGAIIIEGDFDALDGLAEAEERIFLMQHIPYESMTPMADGTTCTEDTLSLTEFAIVAQEVPTLVNGKLNPRIVAAPGSVEHWRFIHGGVTSELTIGVYPADDADCTSWGTAPVSMHQIATDGIAWAAQETRDDFFITTGGRVDVMFEMPDTEGHWCVVAEYQGPPGPGNTGTTQAIATVTVDADAGAATGALVSDTGLASVATPPLDCTGTVDGTQDAIFAQQTDTSGNPCEGAGGGGVALNINCKSFDPSNPRLVTGGTTDEWTVTTEGGPHPMHIHINPFTVCEGTIGGETVTTPHWRDTLMIDPGGPAGGDYRLRMYYETYTGSFVMHCHKLHHEDGGMMEIVTIQ